MAILGIIPVVNCQSIDKTLNFYQQILQFVVIKKRQTHDQLQWVHIMHGSITLMLQTAEPPLAETAHTQQSKITLYFFVDNIDELHHLIKVKYKTVSDIRITDYQVREFSLLDPEGNTITVGQKT